MNKIWQSRWSFLILCGPLACSNGTGGRTEEPGAPDPDGNGPEGDPPAELAEPGLHWEGGDMIFRTEPFTVAPGDESYLCWATNLEEDVKINAFHFPGGEVVHHFMFSQTAAPEPDGWSVCEGLLKPTWRPLFTAGAGENELRLPEDVAHELGAGAQLVVQLHLLNTTTESVTGTTEIAMEVTDRADTEPVQIGGFGSFQIALPPSQKSSIQSDCTLPATGRMVALMPHMHKLGTSLKLELGTSADDAEVIYARENWDFDQQTVDNLDMTVEQGKYARMTCNYDNTTDRTISYGESTLDEMCFLGVFWVRDPMNCVVF